MNNSISYQLFDAVVGSFLIIVLALVFISILFSFSVATAYYLNQEPDKKWPRLITSMSIASLITIVVYQFTESLIVLLMTYLATYMLCILIGIRNLIWR